VEPATWNLDLLHIRLGGQWDDGLELGAADSAHGHSLPWFKTLKIRVRDLGINDRKVNQYYCESG